MKRITGQTTKKEKKNSHIFLKISIILALIIIILFLLLFSIKVKTIEIRIDSIKKETSEETGEETAVANIKITEEDITNRIGININDQIFAKSKKQIIESIKQNPYVDEVEVKRNLNGKLSINVTQKEVAYLINYAGSYIYIDKFGYMLEVNEQSTNVPVLIGTTTDFSGLSIEKEQSKLNDDDLEKLTVVNSIMDSAKSNEIASLITSIDITQNKNYILRFETEGKTAYLGDCKDINTKILYIKSILEKEKGNNGEIFTNVDLDSSYVFFRESV